MERDFTVAKVGWLTRRYSDLESRDHFLRMFWSLTRFLEDNELLVRPLAEKPEQIDDEYCIRASDLTPEGMKLIRAALDRWMKRVDRGTPPENTGILEKALKKIREAEG